jgi:hypothetical protein
MSITACNTSKTISCPDGYMLIFISSEIGVKKNPNSNVCSMSADDCFMPYSIPASCAGSKSCTLRLEPNKTLVADCQNRMADYYYGVYQCVPSE